MPTPTAHPWPAYRVAVHRFGLVFHPEKKWHDYGGHPRGFGDDRGSGEAFDSVVAAAFVAGDPYAVALEVWRETGLLGANDAGPSAFREAHERWLKAPRALILEHDVPSGCPHISYTELLAAVDRKMNTYERRRDYLVHWFVERGIVVDE
jgi:hypothetical protein